jgi:malonate-semialdehyde dehydrogenase (acetylating)/methylmalonate-semialdehyde dehydrogenase
MAQEIKQIAHFIDGAPVLSESNRTADIYNPATGEVSARVHMASENDVKEAITSCREAFPSWSRTPAIKRARILFRFNQLLETHAEEIARTITSEHGKTFSDALGEVQRGREVVEFACGIPHLMKGEFSDSVGTGIDCFSLKQPLGVCAGISPFNFPAMVGMWMFPVALATGNCFIWKPSEKDPSASLLITKLLSEAGLPDGVLNVIQGDKLAVDIILRDPDIQAVSFVGSTPVAQYIYEEGSRQGKRVQALGGAKNHMVVMPDADTEIAADALMGAAYGSAGERCMAISVAVVVGDQAADELVAVLEKKISKLRVGDGMSKDIDMGPLITKEHKDHVQKYIEYGVEEGATLVVDGRTSDIPAQGFFLGASLFDKVSPEMSIYKEEIFGPVLCVLRANSLEHAIQIVNQHEFGNGTAIFTRDGGAARNFTKHIMAGMVGVNVPIPVPVAFHTFGGWKHSLYGAHGMHGLQGVEFYTRLKTVTTRWPENENNQISYMMPVMD